MSSSRLMFLSPVRGRGEERGHRKHLQPPHPTSPPGGGEVHETTGEEVHHVILTPAVSAWLESWPEMSPS